MGVLYRERTKKLLEALSGIGAEGMIVHNRSNVRYLSGYTGEGLLLIAANVSAIVTDFRYTEQAEQESEGFSISMTTAERTHEAAAAELVRDAGIHTLAYEDAVVTVKGMKALTDAMPGISFVSAQKKAETLREIKDEREIATIEKACRITSEAFEQVLSVIRPGMTEKALRLELETRLYQLGADRLAFDTIIATGANGALPHAVPGERKIEKGHMVTLDFGARVDGYCADMTRTIAVGEIDAEQRKIYDTVLEAQLRALEAIKPGASCRAVDGIARDFIGAAGYEGRFGHGLGHSLGIDIHESPRLSVSSDAILREGIVVTDEPGIYIPGKYGCRIEDTVLVTNSGARRLTVSPKELIIL